VWLDDERLLYASFTKSGSQVFNIRADGSEAAKQISSGSEGLLPVSVAPGGSTAVAISMRPANSTQPQLDVIHLDGTGRREVLLKGKDGARILNGEVSPDGRWLAYQANEMARDEIYVRPFPNVNEARIRIAAGVQPAWCRMGSELFYLDADRYLTQVTFKAESTGASHRVLDRQYSSNNLARSFDISRDCQRFLMLKDEASVPTGTALRMTLLVDWIDDVRRKLPSER
jgi:serine/threonine-protein kinase